MAAVGAAVTLGVGCIVCVCAGGRCGWWALMLPLVGMVGQVVGWGSAIRSSAVRSSPVRVSVLWIPLGEVASVGQEGFLMWRTGWVGVVLVTETADAVW